MLQLSATHQEQLRPAKELDAQLTAAEQRVVRCALTIEGQTAKQIAACLGSRPSTIETHIKKIRAKASEVYHTPVSFGFIVSELKRYYFVRPGAD